MCSKPSGDSRATSSARTSKLSARSWFQRRVHIDRIPQHDDIHHEARGAELVLLSAVMQRHPGRGMGRLVRQRAQRANRRCASRARSGTPLANCLPVSAQTRLWFRQRDAFALHCAPGCGKGRRRFGEAPEPRVGRRGPVEPEALAAEHEEVGVSDREPSPIRRPREFSSSSRTPSMAAMRPSAVRRTSARASSVAAKRSARQSIWKAG